MSVFDLQYILFAIKRLQQNYQQLKADNFAVMSFAH